MVDTLVNFHKETSKHKQYLPLFVPMVGPSVKWVFLLVLLLIALTAEAQNKAKHQQVHADKKKKKQQVIEEDDEDDEDFLNLPSEGQLLEYTEVVDLMVDVARGM